MTAETTKPKRVRREHRRAKSKQIPYRTTIYIVAEGSVTEPRYFKHYRTLLGDQQRVAIKSISSGYKGAPYYLAKTVNRIIGEDNNTPKLIWIVADQDQWSTNQLQKLTDLSIKHKDVHIAISNPSFELWLLLHYEDGQSLKSNTDLGERLKKYLGENYKTLVGFRPTMDYIQQAISRAETTDVPQCTNHHVRFGITTVYRVIKSVEDLLGNE